MDNPNQKLNDYFKKHYPALWLAINHHRTHKGHRITFHHYEYLRAPFLDKTPWQCYMKSTQNGFTEWVTLQAIAKALQQRSIFHIMPTGSLKDRYVKNRFDRSIQFTPFYQDIFVTEEKKKTYGRFAESMSLKHFGGGTIAFVGSNSPSAFTEFPADDVIIDELDQCDQKNILMADERLSNSDDPRRIYISNPTVDDYGIDESFKVSDKKYWHIKCEHCGYWFEMDWFETVVREVGDGDFEVRDLEWIPNEAEDARVMCPKCGKPNDRFKAGEWVKEVPSIKDKSGYQISKIFSSKTRLDKLLDNFEVALTNPDKMQRFWNADLGKPNIADGAKITLKDLQGACGEYNSKSDIKGYPVMGIDVGALCNYVIGYIQPDGNVKIGEIGVLPTNANALSVKAKQKKIKIIVIDARPEMFLVRTLKELFPRTISCFYSEDSAKETVDRYRNVRVDRTSTLDSIKEGLVTRKYILPSDWERIKDFSNQMMAATRIFDPEAHKGQGAYRWTEGSKADHYHHAFNYMTIASRLMVLLR